MKMLKVQDYHANLKTHLSTMWKSWKLNVTMWNFPNIINYQEITNTKYGKNP